MKRTILLLLLGMLLGVAQAQTDTGRVPVADTVAPTVVDTAAGFNYSYKPNQEEIARNMNTIVRMQQERTKKQKRDAMLRIGFGVLMLGLLVVGLMRRKKK